jgi:Tfp pilus assembly protein PilF
MNTDQLANPESRIRRRARQYIEAGQLASAQASLESLVQRAPDDASARMELASVMLSRGQMRASTRQLLQAVPILPDDIRVIGQLVRLLYLSGETVAARACLDHPALARDPSAQALAMQANQRRMLGDIPAAKALMDRAMAAGIDTPGEHHLYAMLLQFTGDVDGAGKVLEKCLRRWPRFGSAAMAQARLRKQTPAANHVDFLQAQIGSMPADSRVPDELLIRAEFESALFKELDDLGRHDEAWSSLARSNAIMHALNPYDAAGETAIADAIVNASSSASSGLSRNGPVANSGGAIPIFIVGMPRSGTPLLDRMLSNHSNVVSAGEINDFLRHFHWAADVPPSGMQGMLRALERSGDMDFAELGARYLQQTQWRSRGRRFYVDKLPTNILMVPFIRQALPHAPILHMVREPMDVCFSNLKAMFGNVSAYSYDMHALAHYHAQYLRLADQWRTAIPDAMLDVSYASLVADPEASLRRVLEYCGLDMEEGCLHPERNASPVATPSSNQVREPIHTRSLGEWHNYAQYMKPLRQALG